MVLNHSLLTAEDKAALTRSYSHPSMILART